MSRDRSTPSLQCDGKIRFASRACAHDRARHMRRKLKEALEPYRCRQCGGWHIGGFLYPRKKRPQRRSVHIMSGGLDA